MHPLKFIVLISLFFISNLGYTQTNEEPGMYITASGDTVKGTNMTFEQNGWSKILKLSYTDINGQKVEISDKDKIPDIVTICTAEGCYDRIYKGKNYSNALRTIDGKLIVYYKDNIVKSSSGGAGGDYIYHIRMPDGNVYKVDKESMKKHIKPLLMECDEFVKNSTGNYSTDFKVFKLMISYYNLVCKD